MRDGAMRQTRCIDCNAIGRKTSRAALKPGPRCETHWAEIRRTVRPYTHNQGFICSHSDCNRPALYRGMCNMHYQRKINKTNPNLLPHGDIRTAIGYSHAHQRVRILFGPASQYPCVTCSKPARNWAYDGTDPTELLGKYESKIDTLSWYSRYPEFYMPMCLKCHAAFDFSIRQKELNEYRQWKLTQQDSA